MSEVPNWFLINFRASRSRWFQGQPDNKSIERLNKASADVATNYEAVIEKEKSGRSSQEDSESKQLKNTLGKAIESCANYYQTNREVCTELYEEMNMSKEFLQTPKYDWKFSFGWESKQHTSHSRWAP